MSQCKSIQDMYGVRCNQGEHHKTYELHIWQGEIGDQPNMLVVWSDEESRDHMILERAFFSLAEEMTTKKNFPPAQYKTMIADLLIRLRSKK